MASDRKAFFWTHQLLTDLKGDYLEFLEILNCT